MEYLLVFADAAEPASWASIAASIVSTGFAVWFGWYTTTVTMPRRDETHQHTITTLVTEFRSEVREGRAEAAAEREKFWQVHREEFGRVNGSLDELSDAIRQVADAERKRLTN